ncbi:MAG: hypothetical protein ACREIQ_02610, partial [Nitrospiria bacterium]
MQESGIPEKSGNEGGMGIHDEGTKAPQAVEGMMSELDYPSYIDMITRERKFNSEFSLYFGHSSFDCCGITVGMVKNWLGETRQPRSLSLVVEGPEVMKDLKVHNYSRWKDTPLWYRLE